MYKYAIGRLTDDQFIKIGTILINKALIEEMFFKDHPTGYYELKFRMVSGNVKSYILTYDELKTIYADVGYTLQIKKDNT